MSLPFSLAAKGTVVTQVTHMEQGTLGTAGSGSRGSSRRWECCGNAVGRWGGDISWPVPYPALPRRLYLTGKAKQMVTGKSRAGQSSRGWAQGKIRGHRVTWSSLG